MIYSTPEFLVWFPAFVGLYWVVRAHAARLALLVAASLAFYAYGEPAGVPLLLAVAALAWAGGVLIAARVRPRLVAGIAIAVLVSDLAAFKLSGLLLLGISFYTFEAIAYLVDVLRAVAPAEPSFIRVMLFVSVFPHLIS